MAPQLPAARPTHVGKQSSVSCSISRARRQQRLYQSSAGSNTRCSSNSIVAGSSLLDNEYLRSSRYSTQRKEALPSAKPTLKLTWAGAGLFFFWQLGAVKYLQERYDLTKIEMAGASGGGLAAILAGCAVDADRVLESAYELSVQHQIWERPLGLLGVWGGIIEKWLDDLLPSNAVELCQDRVELIVTTVPGMQQIGIKHFHDRQDLINIAMASAHVPILLDWKLYRKVRGTRCLDGSFPDFFTQQNCDLLECNGNCVVFDYFDDPNIPRRGRMDMLELKQYSEIRRIMDLGYVYAKSLHELGVFEGFHNPYHLPNHRVQPVQARREEAAALRPAAS